MASRGLSAAPERRGDSPGSRRPERTLAPAEPHPNARHESDVRKSCEGGKSAPCRGLGSAAPKAGDPKAAPFSPRAERKALMPPSWAPAVLLQHWAGPDSQRAFSGQTGRGSRVLCRSRPTASPTPLAASNQAIPRRQADSGVLKISRARAAARPRARSASLRTGQPSRPDQARGLSSQGNPGTTAMLFTGHAVSPPLSPCVQNPLAVLSDLLFAQQFTRLSEHSSPEFVAA